MTRRIIPAGEPGEPPLEVTLRRSSRSRRFSLRVSRLDGKVTLSLPDWASETEALAFAAEKSDWIRGVRDRAAPLQVVGLGTALPVEGAEVTIRPATLRAPQREGGDLLVPGDAAQVGARVEAWLKALARDRLTRAVDGFAADLGRRPARITLRDTRSRWGSCAADGSLMFNWRLVMAPPTVLAYVAAHEVAHLAQMNHSPAFWAVVERLMPGHAPQRAWLKRHGGGLQRYIFRSD